MAKIKINRATEAQLLAFATTSLGLEVDASLTKPQIRAKMVEAGFTDDEFEVEDAVAGEGATGAPLTAESVAGRKLVLINIPIQEGVAGGTEAVPVGVNGTVARIMRGVDVEVPAEYVEVLNNAKKLIYERGPNGELTNPKEAHIYPFSILRVVE